MQVGFIGCGNMAHALAQGWNRPVICADPVRARADSFERQFGGRSVATNAEVAAAAELVVLAHKPAQLEQVAAEIAAAAPLVVSILGGVSLARLRSAYRNSVVIRTLPSTPVALRKGVILLALDPTADSDDAGRAAVRDLLAELGTLIEIAEEQVDVAMNLMSCAPAYNALVAEAQIDAGIRRGLVPGDAAQMVIDTMEGTAALLRERHYDTLAVRREVTSPGGSTARGLAALERGGLRAAFNDAIDAVLDS